MAGSWQHATARDGRLLDPVRFGQMIENGGDAYEMAEEMYGMAHWLAGQLVTKEGREDQPPVPWEPDASTRHRDFIELARQNHRHGLAIGGVVPELEQLPGDDEDESPLPVFPVHARFSYPDGGREAERAKALRHLEPGRVYTVRSMQVGQSDTWLELLEVPGGHFSSCLFTPVQSSELEEP